MNKIVIGIDQSYKDTGVSVSYNGVLKAATDIYTEHLEDNSEKRKTIYNNLYNVFNKMSRMSNRESAEVVVIIERIRLRSQGFLNIDYIKSIGALNALIIDLAKEFSFPVYSVDTRAWKSQVVGTSKEIKNSYGIDSKKWPTILWCIKHGYKDKIINYDVGKRKKGILEENGRRYTYNDNIADSICISLYGFIPINKQLLEREK